MKKKLIFNEKTYFLERYPKTEDKNLQAWSNAELLALAFISNKNSSSIYTYNDRFGVWNTLLNTNKLITIWTYASQQEAIYKNLKLNNISKEVNFKTPLSSLENIPLVLLKVPKSVALFELFLQQIYKGANLKTEVVCCFMTKYFSDSYLKVASVYFEDITQTKAWKKARLLILKQPKKIFGNPKNINTVFWKNEILQQYYGVFSSAKIDIGTQFLLQNLKLKPTEKRVLDVASGNGIIAFEIAKQQPETELFLVDDFNLAVASSKINLQGKNATNICAENLKNVPKNYFDLVVSNPPFHFEHENNIEITLRLFKEIKDCLHSRGRFILVANRHLNYKTHLILLFSKVLEIAVNKKFVVYECG